MQDNFEDLIFEAALCERADNYQVMVEIMKRAIKLIPTTQPNVHIKVRNLFSVAYKNIAGSRRSAHRIYTAEKSKYEKDNNKSEIVKRYITEVETELNNICDDVILFITSSIQESPVFSDIESKVFFLKMKGDYLRYRAEVNDDKKTIEESGRNYSEARELAKELESTNPVNLGLALNYSVYLYEIARDGNNACAVAKDAFEQAIQGLDKLGEDHYKDSTLIMQLLRDNMTLWSNQDDNLDNEGAKFDDIDKEEL